MNNLQQQARDVMPRWINGGKVVDDKAWARRLKWRHEQGDKDVSIIQLNFALEALGEQHGR